MDPDLLPGRNPLSVMLGTGLEERAWNTLLPLVLEHVGAVLARDRLGDLLRARLACKHWHACLSRCVTRLTLYARAVHPPAATPPPPSSASPPPPSSASPPPQQQQQQQQQQQPPTQPKPPQSHQPAAQPPPQPPPADPALSSPPTPPTAFHIQLIPSLSPSVRHVTLRGPALDPDGLAALAQGLPSLTSLSLQAGRSPPAASAAADCAGSYLWPPTAPARLERLWLSFGEDVPPDALHRLLLCGPAPPPAPARETEPAAVATAQAPARLPLRELGLLPQLACLAGPQRQRVPYLDLSPLLDPRLAGVTRLVLPAVLLRQPPPSAAGARQQQQQQQPAFRHGPPSGGTATRAAAALGVEEVVGRLTQLKSLTLMAQVELAALYPACLAPLTALQELHLPSGVYCESAADLRQLTGLSGLTALELNFGSEWWIDAGDLRVLSRLTRLCYLKLALDYGLEESVSSGDELYGQSDDANGSGGDSDNGGDDDHGGGDQPGSEDHLPAARQVGEREAAAAMAAAAGATEGGHRYDTLEGLASALAGAWARARGPVRAELHATRVDPGVGDDWRAPLAGLTQLRRLEMRLCNGGGRHLAEALHAAAWLAAPPALGGGGADGDASGGGGEGAWLELRDARAAAFLDVSYWSKVASAAAAAAAASRAACMTAAAAVVTAQLQDARALQPPPSSASGTSSGNSGAPPITAAAGASAAAAAATAAAPPPPSCASQQALSPPHARPILQCDPPLVRLQLGFGRALCVSYAHIMCLGLMTKLRFLDLSFEVADVRPIGFGPTPGSSPPAASCDAGPAAATGPSNPLLALARLHRLRHLRVRVKQPWPGLVHAEESGGRAGSGGGRRSSDGGGSPATPMAPMDGDVVHAWMEGMPLLLSLALRGVGRLDERALTAVGRHAALRSLELRLKVTTAAMAAAAPLPAGLEIGYGSYYALRSAASLAGPAAGAGGGGGSLLGSSAATPLGTSPQEPGAGGSYMAGRAAPAAGPTRGSSLPMQVPPPGRGGAAAAAAGGAAAAAAVAGSSPAAAASLGRSGAWRDRLLGEGFRGGPELLAGVPYFIRPHHLPPSLTSLDLTNAAFSAEWADVSGGGAAAAAAQLPPPPLTAPSVAVTAAAAADGSSGSTSLAASGPAAGGGTHPASSGVARPLPRLVSLRLARRPPKCRRMQERAAASFVACGLADASTCAPSLDPTRLTDWHLVHLTACQPTLSQLELYDTDGGGSGSGAGEAGKLHHRAVAQLGRLSYLESLTLHVGNRLRWRAQEALFASLPSGLRSLCLYAAHVYREAVETATRLTALTSLQVLGYAEPDYVRELEAAAAAVQAALPACAVLVVPRDVDFLFSSDDLP